MNPYEILGLPFNATDSQIKNAYRKLVKEYHPDRNKNIDAHHRVSEINKAYEILSDPAKRAAYDNPFQFLNSLQSEQPEDPVEVYKREFKRKRWEEDRAEKVRKESVRKQTHKIMRYVAMPILAFAILLVVDNWLPTKTIIEAAYDGFPKIYSNEGSVRQYSKYYMKTRHFTFRVDYSLQKNYPYGAIDKPQLKIRYTPIFSVPRFASVTVDGNFYDFQIRETIFSSDSLSRWWLLISAMFTVGYNKYGERTYSLCFLPVFFFAMVLLIMLL